MHDDRLKQTMLLDYYGELLTEKQRQYCDLHYNSDLSLGEISEQMGVSRQAVWDLIHRAESTMQDIEAKTGFLAREIRHRAHLQQCLQIARTLPAGTQRQRLEALLGELLEH